MNVTVLGCGRWGTFLAWYSNKMGYDVRLWGREDSRNLKKLKENRENEYLKLDDNIILTSSLEEALDKSNYIIISIKSQQLRSFARILKNYDIKEKTFILCMKGIEDQTGKRLSQVMEEELGKDSKIAIWVGPGHVQNFINNIPNCMVIDSKEVEITKKIVKLFGSDLIRFYYGKDLIGNEIGAASKNVVGLAAGMLDGIGYSSLKGALMARGTREISRLVAAMGGHEITIYGLSHLGDYEATLFSPYSNNRAYGESVAKNIKFDKLAEGVSTVKALLKLSKKYKVDLPIARAVYSVIYENKDPKNAIVDLFIRPLKFEFMEV